MRKIHLLGLALFAMFAFSSIAASSAFAAAEWLEEKLPIPSPEKLPVDSEGTLLLEDMSVFPKLDILCTGDNKGTIGPGKLDEITEIVVLSCVVDEGSCKILSVKPVNLPWDTELELMEPKPGENLYLDKILNANSNPGWSVECEGLPTDTCTGNSSVDIQNLLTENPTNVNAIFNSESEHATCSATLGEGLVEGEILILSEENLNIEVSG